jgi:hypothetical protein
MIRFKSLAALIVVLLMAASLAAQDKVKQKVKTFRNSKRFTVNYDKFKDQTLVTAVFATGNSRGGLLRGAISFKGEIPTDKPDYFFLFELDSSSWRYLSEESHKLYAIIDGERMELGKGEYDGKTVTLGVIMRTAGVNERLAFLLSAETFSKLANGKSVELKIGSMEFRLKDEHQEAFRDLMSLADIKE